MDNVDSHQSRSMDGKTKTPVELAIGHVLFIDIVGYSKLLTSEQREQQQNA